jgi:hypothetical protein
MENTSSERGVSVNKNHRVRQGDSQILTYNPAFDLDFVERLLGRRQRSDLPRSTRKRLSMQKSRLQALIKPRLIWKEFPIANINKSGVLLNNGTFLESRKMAYALKDATKIIIFIATVGNKIDLEIESLISSGELAHGYIADALGSGAVESLSDRFHREKTQELAKKNQTAGLRFSPGYCDWPVTDQKKLFSLLDNESVRVDLNDTSLMQPRKSISAVFGIYQNKNISVENTFNPCRRCGKKDCIARRVETIQPGSN